MLQAMQRAITSLFGGRDADYLAYNNDPYYSLKSLGGERVSRATAMGLPAFRQGVSLLSGDVAKVPLSPYRVNPDGSVEADKSHPAYRLTAWQPNQMQSAYDFRRHVMYHAIIYSHGYALIDRVGGRPVGLYPLLSDRTYRRYIEGEGVWRIESEVDGQLMFFRDDEVLHISSPFAALGGLHDSRLLEEARNAIGLGLAANNFASRFFATGGRQGGVLEVPAGLRDKAKEALEKGWKKAYETNDGQFKTIILRDGVKFNAAQFRPDEGQMVESRQEQVKEVARLLNIPAHKLGHDGRTAYNSLEMEERAYVNSTLSHWFKSWEGECNMKLLTEAEKRAMSHRFSHDLSELIASDSETRARVHDIYLSNGTLTTNEVRSELKLPPVQAGDEEDQSRRDLVEAIQKIYLGVGKVITSSEARAILNQHHGASLVGDIAPMQQEAPPDAPQGVPQVAPQETQEDMTDAVRTHLMALLDQQRQLAIKELAQRVKENATRSPGEKFVRWFDANYDKLSDSVLQRHMGHTLRAFAAHESRDVDDITSEQLGAHIESLKQTLGAVIANTTTKRHALCKAIKGEVEEWLKSEFTVGT